MDLSDKDVLRDVTLEGTGYRLVTWDAHAFLPPNHDAIGYAFFAPGEADPIFAGEDFGNPRLWGKDGGRGIDSDNVLRSILGFLTLGKDDTDGDYFTGYTERQLAFRDGNDREYLSLWGPDNEHEPMAFVDNDDERDHAADEAAETSTSEGQR
jgi:hypothetical protein